jgi:16S rRNA (guanine966-N2)-methyltransferase
MLGDLEGAVVLDLFAGSGALGLEALSRGAASATFVDSDARAVAAVRRNLDSLGATAEVYRRDALAYLEDAAGAEFDLAFVDPPYSSAVRLAEPLSERLPPALTPRALIVTESDKRMPLDLGLPLRRERTYGDTRIAIHAREG